MITATINNREIKADEGSTVLQAALKNGIHIPTLCYHEGLPAYGACRMCLVEITQGGRSKLESSCTRPIEQGMEIRTDTKEIQEHRKMIMEFLLARCPESEAVLEMAKEVGITETRFDRSNEDLHFVRFVCSGLPGCDWNKRHKLYQQRYQTPCGHPVFN